MEIETKNKRRIYIFLSIILGILLGTIAHAVLEKVFIDDMLSGGTVPQSSWGRNCFLPPSLSAILLLGGAALGYILGVRWWQMVYVEKRHWRMNNK